jgi:hypothetical protein
MRGSVVGYRALGSALLALTLAACAESSDPAGLLDAPLDVPTALGPGDVRFVEVCKTGPEGSFADFEITSTGGAGTLLLGNSFTITGVHPFGVLPAACRTVWQSSGATPSLVTVTESGGTLGTFVQDIVLFATGGSVVDVSLGEASVGVNWDHGAFIIFKNGFEEEPPPPPGLEGCTPGFWKQPHHFDFWTDYTPGQTWGSVFADPGSTKANKGQTFTANSTLVQSMNMGGGGILALARHAVAALLNSTSATVDYPYTTAQVIATVNAALASGDYQAAKDQLASANELGCGPRD